MSTKQQLLDPIGTICKLIFLNFAEPQTKISIYNHIIQIQQPTLYQGAIRMIYGDGRDDISELYDVVVRLIEWYIIKNEDPISGTDEIKCLVEHFCEGLESLQITYKNGTVVLCLQYYINLLKNSLKNEFDKESLPKCIVNRETLLDYNKIKGLWDINTIRLISGMFNDTFTEYKKEKPNKTKIDGYLGAIKNILGPKDLEFKELIKESNKG